MTKGYRRFCLCGHILSDHRQSSNNGRKECEYSECACLEFEDWDAY